MLKNELMKSKPYNYQEHKPCGFMLNLVNAVDNTNRQFLCSGEDASTMCFAITLVKKEMT